MEDLLNMKIDDIPDNPSVYQSQRNEGRKIDPFNHYEVECNKTKTIFVGEHKEEAESVFANSHSEAKALIHVVGKRREVLDTNAPYMYLSYGGAG